jgi:ubiquinone/menaquinone biosynthesis C-methylase UbiE
VDIAQRIASHAPSSVLETASGTGIVTRALRDALPARTHLTATDLNVDMLEIARAKFRSNEQVAFRPTDATALPFPDTSFDAVICQFGVMFFPDKDESYGRSAACSSLAAAICSAFGTCTATTRSAGSRTR